MEDWKKTALQLHATYGRNWSQIADRMTTYFPDKTHRQLCEKLRAFCTKAADKEPEASKDRAPVVENLEPTVLKLNWAGERLVRFGLMGDTQINSKYTQLTHLHNYYDICKHEGITDIYHTGDIDEGEQMRKGHQYECYNQGIDDHTDEIVRVYPKREGITTHFICGNHDASMLKLAGHDIGQSIAKERPDMHYLGRDYAIVNISPNCPLELRHPWDGTAYAISYKIQKMCDAMMGGEKPSILGVGHYHKMEDLFYRNIHCYQTGCFQAQTNFMRGKGIAAMMGGWILEVYLHDDGTITRIKDQKIVYYKAIKDDYLNWR